jgi:hypothetical protein
MSKVLNIQEISETTDNISYVAYKMRNGIILNDQHKDKPTIHPDHLMKLPDLQAYLKLAGDYPIAKV